MTEAEKREILAEAGTAANDIIRAFEESVYEGDPSELLTGVREGMVRIDFIAAKLLQKLTRVYCGDPAEPGA